MPRTRVSMPPCGRAGPSVPRARPRRPTLPAPGPSPCSPTCWHRFTRIWMMGQKRVTFSSRITLLSEGRMVTCREALSPQHDSQPARGSRSAAPAVPTSPRAPPRASHRGHTSTGHSKDRPASATGTHRVELRPDGGRAVPAQHHDPGWHVAGVLAGHQHAQLPAAQQTRGCPHLPALAPDSTTPCRPCPAAPRTGPLWQGWHRSPKPSPPHTALRPSPT